MELPKLRPGRLCCVRYVVFAHHNFRHISDPEQETRCTLSLGINQVFFLKISCLLGLSGLRLEGNDWPGGPRFVY